MDDSKVVTYTAGGEAVESATCAKWFLFGCTFAEPDICDALVTGVAKCCGDGTTAPDDTDTKSSPNSACLRCLEDPAADPVQSCSDVCTTSTQGSTSHSAACLECIEAPGADPADCVSQCDTTTAATNGNDVACAQCLEGEGANPGVCDEICHGVGSGTPSTGAPDDTDTKASATCTRCPIVSTAVYHLRNIRALSISNSSIASDIYS